jgi:signal recognition particle subunit SRP54
MFDALSGKLQGIFRSLRGQGVLSEAHVDAALREIRLALLEADAHFKVVKDLLAAVRARAMGQEVLRSLTPDQAVLRIVRDEMVALLGGESVPSRIRTSSRLPSVVLLVGLQGSGKTTTAAKLGRFLVRGGHHPLLVSTDVYRPAAREQLRLLARQSGLALFEAAGIDAPEAILSAAVAESRAVGHDLLLVDTAGRLHVDDELMSELARLEAAAEPTEVLYVADAMTGQDAVRSATAFGARVGLTGVILSKLDGDARGGAALSIASVTGRAIRFAGVGEKVDDFELFDPARMTARILGMGDVLGLIERVEQAVDRDKAEDLARRIRRSEFTLEDYREQLAQLRKMGPLDQVLGMLPGMGAVKGVDAEAGEIEMRRAAAIIGSMTEQERQEPSIINGSRRKRIAQGSGTRVEDVNRLLKQFAQARKLMKSLGGGSKAMRRFAARMPMFR